MRLMKMKSISVLMGLWLLASTLSLAFYIQPTAGSATIYIRESGIIDPPTAPISRTDNFTYTLIGDICDSIVVERSNIVIDGNGHLLQCNGTRIGNGLYWNGVNNVTVRNTRISGFRYGVYLNSTSDNTFSRNHITDTSVGICFERSSHNNVSRNNITASEWYGILLYSSSNTSIYGNNIAENWAGVNLHHSTFNMIYENNITANDREGILLSESQQNTMYGNSIRANDGSGILLSESSYYNGIVGNTVANNNYGINVEFSPNNLLSTNNITANNLYGVSIHNSSSTGISGNIFGDNGLFVTDSYGNTVEDNVVNGKPLIYLEDNSDYDVDSAGQVILVNCDNIRVENLNIANSSVGLELWKTMDCEIANSNITANSLYGIFVYGSSNNSLYGNTLGENDYAGIYLRGSSNNSVNENNIRNNGAGIFSESSQNNWISKNNITANEVHGVILCDSPYNTICENNISANVDSGIYICDSSGNSIVRNEIAANSQYGMSFYRSSNNDIVENSIIANGLYGVTLHWCLDNRFYHNNFANTFHVYSIESADVWGESLPYCGNYYDHYSTDVFHGLYQNITGSDGMADSPFIIDRSNQDYYPLMKPYPWDPHGIGVTSVVTSKTIVGRGYNISISAMMFNYGNNSENLDLTSYANETILGEINNIQLASRNFTVVQVSWSTSSAAYGNYNISICVDPVPNETDISDNSLTYNWVFVTIPGDVDGDRDVSIFDIVLMARGYGTQPPNSKYIPNCDIDGDGDIDIFDLVRAAGNYGKSW